MDHSILISKVIKDFEWGAYGQGISSTENEL
jgi:hypothetical protein